MGTTLMDVRDALFDNLYEIARNDARVVVLTADADAFSLKKFRDEMPDRVIDVGVSEQNAILVATGMAMSGFRPFVYSITPFLTMRCYEQIKIDVCSHNLPICLIGLGAGLSFSFDGATHHAMHDIGVMCMLPEMEIYNVADVDTARRSISQAHDDGRPSFIRLDKGVYSNDRGYTTVGDGVRMFRDQTVKINILTTGTMLHIILRAVDGLDVGLFDVYKLKPVDHVAVASICACAGVIVVEEHSCVGGLGDIIGPWVPRTTKLTHIALPHKQLFDYGEREWLLAKYGLSAQAIRDRVVLELLSV